MKDIKTMTAAELAETERKAAELDKTIKKTRERIQAKKRRERDKRISKLPKEVRDALHAAGIYRADSNTICYRPFSFHAK